jgi:hypothetical protein
LDEAPAAAGKKYASASSISLGGMSGSEAGAEIRDEDDTFMIVAGLDVCFMRGEDDDDDDDDDDEADVTESVDSVSDERESEDGDSRGSTSDDAVCVGRMMDGIFKQPCVKYKF